MSPSSTLSPDQLARDLAIRDLTDPTEGSHAVGLLVQAAVDALSARWGCEVRWCRGPRIVPVADNYDALGFGAETVTRDSRYTRYVDGDRMLRSHSSAMVPPALRALAAGSSDDVLLVCPGIVFRRDAIDWQHTGTPHQLDLWRIRAGPVVDADMDEMVAVLLAALAPGRAYRQEPRVHPYTHHGRQVDVADRGRWVEVWECGLAHPDVLGAAGLDGRSGLALGMGLDRLVMLAKGIGDIRLLRSEDPRVAGQMTDLAPYQPVSTMPPISRDLSIAVAEEEDDETIGDRLRDTLGADVACLEEVSIVSVTPLDRLPAAAVERLGAQPGQKNVLVRMVLRDLERTLTDETANAMRDRVYAALHQGKRYEWAQGGSA